MFNSFRQNRRHHTNTILPLILISILSLYGCGGGSSSSSDDNSNTGNTTAFEEGVKQGVLLEGDGSANATAATEDRPPQPVSNNSVIDRLITTRLIAVLNTNATVDEVNTALIDNNVSISTMIANEPFVTLAMDAVADTAAAQALADSLKATGAFIYVRPAYTTSQPANNAPKMANLAYRNPVSRVSTTGDTIGEHLVMARAPASWSLKRSAAFPVSYLSSNPFPNLPQHASLPDYNLISPSLQVYELVSPFDGGAVIGFYQLGLAAGLPIASGSNEQFVGFNPEANGLQETNLYDTTNLDPQDAISGVLLNWQSSGNVVLLNTFNFNDPEGAIYSYVDRAFMAFLWRRLILGQTFDEIIFVVSTGDQDANQTPTTLMSGQFNNALALATIADLRPVAQLSVGTYGSGDVGAFLSLYEQEINTNPEFADALENVLLVGASATNGAELPTSVDGEHVRMVGSDVLGPCVLTLFCSSSTETMTGSFAAAPQAAGLIAYLWELDGNLSAEEILLRVQHAYSTSSQVGVVDAYIAALSLDRNLNEAYLRRQLLDVSGSNNQPDGRFDEADIQAYLDAFEAFDGSLIEDFSVYDLNGDGRTGGSGRRKFDLDVNNLPSFAAITQQLNVRQKLYQETALTDADILCYYAFSDIYQGTLEDIPEIPNCQNENITDGISSIHFNGSSESDVSLSNKYPEYVEDSDDIISFGELDASLSSSSQDSTDDNTFSADASATSNATIDITPTPESESIILRATITVHNASSTSQEGYENGAPGATANASASDYFAFGFTTVGTVYYRVSGSFQGEGQPFVDLEGGGDAFGTAYLRSLTEEGYVYHALTNYDFEFNGPNALITGNGSIPENTYTFYLRLHSNATTYRALTPTSHTGSGSATYTLEISKTPF